jgi:4a-hydroxytetrahydrobiopterin dehydratase
MPKVRALSDTEVDSRLDDVPLWTLAGGKLHRELRFADFVTAFAFMASVALVAEKMDHHPEWSNVWATVVIDLTTHDAGGLSDLDFTLAAKIDALATGAR